MTYVRTDVNEVMTCKKSIVKESPRRRIGRRVGAAGMALAAVLDAGEPAMRRTGGGYIGAPLRRR